MSPATEKYQRHPWLFHGRGNAALKVDFPCNDKSSRLTRRSRRSHVRERLTSTSSLPDPPPAVLVQREIRETPCRCSSRDQELAHDVLEFCSPEAFMDYDLSDCLLLTWTRSKIRFCPNETNPKVLLYSPHLCVCTFVCVIEYSGIITSIFH